LLPLPEAAIGAEVYPVADANGLVDGFGIGVTADSQLATSFALTDWLSVEIHLEAFATGFGVVMRKGQDAKLLSALFDSSPATVLDNVALDARVAFVTASPDGLPIVLMGNADATRLEVASIKLVGGLAKPPAGALDVYSEVALPKLTLTVNSEDGDGFLQDVLGDGFTAAADLTITPERRRLVDFSSPILSGINEPTPFPRTQTDRGRIAAECAQSWANGGAISIAAPLS